MIECNALAGDDWPDSQLRNSWRNIDNNPGSPVGWITSLFPVRVRTSVDGTIIAILELLTLLQLSDSYDVLIFHTISIKNFYGTLKPRNELLETLLQLGLPLPLRRDLPGVPIDRLGT